MAEKIIIYGTDKCPFCIQARTAYGDRAVFINVENDPEKFNEMLTFSGGKRKVPVIVKGNKVSVGGCRGWAAFRFLAVPDLCKRSLGKRL